MLNTTRAAAMTKVSVRVDLTKLWMRACNSDLCSAERSQDRCG